MDNRPAVNEMSELIDEFRRRFPLFDSITGQFGVSIPSERIPWFFGFILAAAANSGAGPCCIILDKTPGTTAIAAILSGLLRLKSDFPNLVERYARSALERGQRVKVNPSNFVYEYEGVWEDFPDFFRLKFLGKEARRSIPLVDVLRLEPTDRVRPKGSGASDLGTFERSPLDHLLDLTTSGNNSLIQNAVLVQIPRAQLARIADITTLAPMHARAFARLSSFLHWGYIERDGTLVSNDRFQVLGEPLIAATSVPEDLALASSAADTGTKAVFVDGARRLARNLQSYDDIADRQRLVILASPDEREDLELLKDRGCPVWYMSADEMLIGEVSDGGRTRASLVGATIRAADMRRRCCVRTVECHDDVLQAAADSLDRVVKMIANHEEALGVEEVVARLFRILFECSECCFGIPEGIITDLRTTREQIAQQTKWLEPAVREELRDAASVLERAAADGSGEQKADAIMRSLCGPDQTWAVATRSPRTAVRLRDDLNALGTNVSVLPVTAIRSEQAFDGIIVPAWPNDQRFSRLKNMSVTPDIRILAYPFEKKWILRHQIRERNYVQSNRLEVCELSSILGVEPRLLSSLNTSSSDVGNMPPGPKIPLDHPVFKLEDRVTRQRGAQPPLASSGEDGREAQLVEFFGGCYALLTEWAELPVLNELINSNKSENATLTRETVSKLKVGDFVLFRASGDKEFLRSIAETYMGSQEYKRARDVAELWKVPLRRLGHGPAEVQKRLADHGLVRTLPTVAGWLRNPDRIGPGNLGDIETIAKIAGDTETLSNKEEVGQAITRVRAAHQMAGLQLTGLILGELQGRANELGDQPALLDLHYGQAWVIEVAFVETKRRAYPASQVNRLLWATDGSF